MVISFGRFRMLDLGDLTWNKEHGLVCPNNLLGAIDLYLTTHHGLDQSGADVLVHAIRPRVAVMNNGATKGGIPSAWQIVRDAPGLQDIWQVHRAVNADAAHNAPEQFIANLDETTAFGLKVSAERDGSFVVTNARNGQTKKYGPAVELVRRSSGRTVERRRIDFFLRIWSSRRLMTASSTCRAFRASSTPSVGVSSSLLLGLLLTGVGIIRMPTAAG